MGEELMREVYVSKSCNRPLRFMEGPSKYYSHGGGFTLVNGIKATLPRISDEWLGWSGKDMEAVSDLGKAENITEVKIGFLKEELNWIYMPTLVQVFVSNDDITYTKVAEMTASQLMNLDREVNIKFSKQSARYVKVMAKHAGKIPSGKPGAGEDCWLFCDEININ